MCPRGSDPHENITAGGLPVASTQYPLRAQGSARERLKDTPHRLIHEENRAASVKDFYPPF
jgi:hypothetical protein